MEHSTLTRRKALALAASGLATSFLSRPAHADVAPVLVELFTSQGCSSCPPADKLAGKLMQQPGVIMVSFNVDYWDQLGWRDTLASPDFTERQMDYAHSRGDNNVYTPQMVINGSAYVVGSNQSAVSTAISSARRDTHLRPITFHASDTEFLIDLPDNGSKQEATLWLLAVAPSVSVEIKRGENSGKTITYHNVVRKLVPAGMWDGTATKLKLPRKGIMTAGCKGCIAVLQKDKVGQVLGLAQWGSFGA